MYNDKIERDLTSVKPDDAPAQMTQGKWRDEASIVALTDGTPVCVVYVRSDGGPLGDICRLQSGGGVSRAETRANGRAIAALPDLLIAARAALDYLDGKGALDLAAWACVTEDLRSAIATVEGRA